MPKMSYEGLVGTVLALIVVMLDQAGIKNPWILWIAFGFALVLILHAIKGSSWGRTSKFISIILVLVSFAAFGKYLYAKLNPPFFNAVTGGAVEKNIPSEMWGVWMGSARKLVSVDYMTNMKITNMMSVSASIKSYSLEVQDKNGEWVTFINMPIPQHLDFVKDEEPRLFFIEPKRNGYFCEIVPHSPLDDVLRTKSISPGETVSGWTYWGYPYGFTRMALHDPLVTRITVEDWAGHRSVAIDTHAATGAANGSLETNNGFTLGKSLDINEYTFLKATQQ